MCYDTIKSNIINKLFENKKLKDIEKYIKDKNIPSEYKLILGKILFPQNDKERNIFPYNIWVDNDSFNFSAEMKNELKNILSYMDNLLESLPDEKIEEFAKSEYYDSYKKLFKELGLV